MEKIIFSLDPGETSKVVKWIQLIFGIVCIVTAMTWIIVFPGSAKSGSSFWISFLFLLVFGLYMINSGLGKGRKFVEISETKIILKKVSFLPQKEIPGNSLNLIKVMPLSITFVTKDDKKTVLRLGTTYTDTIRPLKDALYKFADNMKIPVETGNEEL